MVLSAAPLTGNKRNFYVGSNKTLRISTNWVGGDEQGMHKLALKIMIVTAIVMMMMMMRRRRRRRRRIMAMVVMVMMTMTMMMMMMTSAKTV